MLFSQVLTPMPDAEIAILYALGQMEPNIRFVTIMPTGDLTKITARIRRIGGTMGRHIWVDHPVIDIDIWGQVNKGFTMAEVSTAARNVQADMQSLNSAQVLNGVIQHVTIISGPKIISEVNNNLVRNSATYLVRIHPLHS
jgi:hypothetical protein